MSELVVVEVVYEEELGWLLLFPPFRLDPTTLLTPMSCKLALLSETIVVGLTSLMSDSARVVRIAALFSRLDDDL